MNIWVMTGSYDGEQFASSHLTEKGAVLAAIGDLLQLLGVEDEETAKAVQSHHDLDEVLFEWNLMKLRDKPRDELWPIFHEWAELTWDSGTYNVEVIKTKLAA